ncbi:CHAT domain-containing protein [Streptomyces sp. S1A1-8]|nr:CHAT domain-containing protein [Streptomyces sp. RLA2-12]QDN63299.1 CHAT domain-containing protein [Streptomyces sp. S1D4-20]QDN73349.1 CHAT domain-containing protein [Streptomyces sp. S1D4-14]QDO04046.1 CHAT domain-containing protein [Streptomyces sp. RLB1-9]QDO25838.1 CHAT domain-containing protein [Streptomyces sp. S1A1-8]QDO35952.1 CHAT domain-containing protein [Streptomyces sp. S1A1-3]QDO55941.1 CHAT domain-containing protein [Streptomyces sp. RLB3-5]QDO65840.1 CHAT domain-containin
MEAVNASLRRLGVPSLDPRELDSQKPLALIAEEGRHRSIQRGTNWVESLDDYARGYLDRTVADRITGNPRDIYQKAEAADLFENLRVAIGSRLETVSELVRPARTTGPAVARGAREPRPERLRILVLASSPEGDLRVPREQKQIRKAVERARHGDQVEFDFRPSATTDDLLDGITRFRPHVVHFSGHSNEDLIVLEQDVDTFNDGVVVTAGGFAKAVAATDDPPVLVVLNSCRSAGQIEHLADAIAPFAIGMSDSIDDLAAITYAAQFYAAIANGHSIGAAHASGKAAVEIAALPGYDLPTLAHAEGMNPWTAILVQRPHRGAAVRR